MPYMNIKINVKVLNLNEFNIEFREYLNFDNDLNTTGFIEDDSNTNSHEQVLKMLKNDFE